MEINFSDALPQKEIVTNELPEQRYESPGSSTATIPASVTVTVRKIPFSLRHNGKSKDFSFLETKTVRDLYIEIGRLKGACNAGFTTPFSSDINGAVVLKTLNLPSVNKIVLHCFDEFCHQNFNSEMLVTSVSTEEQLSGLKEKYRELLVEKVQLEKDLSAAKLEQIRSKALIGRLRQTIKKKE